jgi:hypothetical protein
MTKAKSSHITVQGVVMENKWDDEDNLVGVIIEGDDGHDYVVDPAGGGRRLSRLVNATVRATGKMTVVSNQRVLTVDKFQEVAVDEDSEDDYEDDEDDYEDDEDDYEGGEDDHDDSRADGKPQR